MKYLATIKIKLFNFVDIFLWMSEFAEIFKFCDSVKHTNLSNIRFPEFPEIRWILEFVEYRLNCQTFEFVESELHV